jgi:hypothetical protein
MNNICKMKRGLDSRTETILHLPVQFCVSGTNVYGFLWELSDLEIVGR